MNQIASEEAPNLLNRIVKSTAQIISTVAGNTSPSTTTTTTTTISSSVSSTLADHITTTTKSPFFETNNILHKFEEQLSAPHSSAASSAYQVPVFNDDSGEDVITTAKSAVAGIFSMFTTSTPLTSTQHSESIFSNSISDLRHNFTSNIERDIEPIDALFPQALVASSTYTPNATSCNRINIMGNIVADSAPYLYPFIIEYSLIGAVVIYVMWRHIGRYPK